jgi:hypothetical protein
MEPSYEMLEEIRGSHQTRYGHFDRYNTGAMCTTFSGLVLKYIEL